MHSTYRDREDIKDFITENRQLFEKKLLSEAVNVAEKINDILRTGNIDLLKNAERLVIYIVESNKSELTDFARKEGIAWAQHSLTLSFKLEWVQAIRRTLWEFLHQFEQKRIKPSERENFFSLEKRINDSIDQFLNNFFISYSDYKDELINKQRKNVEHLSVPIIPISEQVAILPLIGSIDSYRMATIEEKVLNDIARFKIQSLIMDLSGITDMDVEVIDKFQKVLDGIDMMGCTAVITGLRAELVRKMIHLGISFDRKAITKGTLQQTVQDFINLV
ncbi:Anti-anti-sigma regulatory factor (antagonist of anti-sigma factor) [Bacillus sp. OV322]|uniref:STAS domain-containing protein n=1 Tax=Bacillus sp. OV322 TaxID=1882764 RepID=UPI0008EAD0FE|nr:STAS domain-containing protein [Bacillus sp. OV322]SFC64952.1 Anti-anti-sigma regulatory factor (antagonist of anti-sigma factor) [Bacillus sp. OV322]